MQHEHWPELPEFLKRDKASAPKPVADDRRDVAVEPVEDTRPRLFLERKLKGYGISPGWHTYEVERLGRKWAKVRIDGKPVRMRRKTWDALVAN